MTDEKNIELSPREHRKETYCGNCGRHGHIYKQCLDPLTSYGLICYRKYEDAYQIILIRRKDTIGYVEFLRGKYNVDNSNYIIKLLNLMTYKEKKRLLDVGDFDELREILGMSKKNTIYKTEYDEAKIKFDKIFNSGKLKNLVDKSNISWNTQEWGLPKGRRLPKESDMICGAREFFEETGLTPQDVEFKTNIKPLEEIYVGINKVKYKHVYYFAEFISDTKIWLDPNNKSQVIEISKIQWCNLQNCLSLIRPYHQEKLNVVKKAFQILINKDKYFGEIQF